MNVENRITVGSPALCIYDANCTMCTKLARWAQKRTDVKFTGYADLTHRGVDPSEYDSYLVFAGETVERGHRAVAAVLKTMGFPWKLLGTAVGARAFDSLGRKVYGEVAERRSCSTL